MSEKEKSITPEQEAVKASEETAAVEKQVEEVKAEEAATEVEVEEAVNFFRTFYTGFTTMRKNHE